MPVRRSPRNPAALADAIRELERQNGAVVAVFKEGDEYVIVWREHSFAAGVETR
jgi:hypothetical protein